MNHLVDMIVITLKIIYLVHADDRSQAPKASNSNQIKQTKKMVQKRKKITETCLKHLTF